MRKTLAAISAAVAAAAAGGWLWWSFDPRYYTARELENPAYPLRRVDVDPMPMKDGMEYFGKIRFDLYIGRDGRVDRVEVIESTMPPQVRERVVKAFSDAAWQPGRKAGGRNVKSVKRVEVDYPAPRGVGRAPMAPDS